MFVYTIGVQVNVYTVIRESVFISVLVWYGSKMEFGCYNTLEQVQQEIVIAFYERM